MSQMNFYYLVGEIEEGEKETISIHRYTKNHEEGALVLMCPICFGATLIMHKLENGRFDYMILKNGIHRPELVKKNKIKTIEDAEFKGICHVFNKYVPFRIIDPNIYNAIRILNSKGYFTKYCCESHPKYKKCNNKKKYINTKTAYISFANFKQMMEVQDTLPISWYVDLRYFKYGSFVIRADRFNKSEAVIDIVKWANELPMRKNKWII